MRTKKDIPAEPLQDVAAESTESAEAAESTARHARTDAARELSNVKNAQKAKQAQKRTAPAPAEEEPTETLGTETLTEALEKTQPKYRRRTSRGTRRGRYRMAALLGLVVLFFAIIGVIATGFLGVKLIQKATDRTDLMNELADIAYPLIEYQPQAFESIDQADQSVLLQASIFRITEVERIRRLREGDQKKSPYEVDQYGRITLSVAEVEESFATLFGKNATPHHQTLGEQSGVAYTFEYDEAKACYYVPVSSLSSLYTTLTDRIEVRGKVTRIRVGYVRTAKLDYDVRGNRLPPSAEDVDYYQWFSFTQEDGRWIITAVSDA